MYNPAQTEKYIMKIMGINIGSISVKTAILESDAVISHQIIPHFGDPTSIIEDLENSNGIEYFGVSGYLGEINETDAIQTALFRSGKSYDAVISLGGESFVVYLLKDNKISTVISQNRCAAGSGEFLSQQIGRLNLTLEEAIELGKKGKAIHLASRCSVHCKSDITHKLNRGEASIEDIIFSVHKMISDKIVSMLQKSQQAINNVLLIGGLSRNDLFVSILKDSIVSINIHVLPESSYFEAFGTALIVQDSPIHTSPNIIVHPTFSNHQPLSEAEDLVKIIDPKQLHQEKIFGPLILGVDGGSTTTKVAVVDQSTFKIVASCYVRTNGDPLEATRHCLHEVKKQIGDQSFNLVATTGSAREIIGAFLGTNLVFNEISAHSTGALYYDPEVDTIFEIGGQDAKYIYIENGSPVDYAMNAACSAGTGSFLEESCKGDLGISVEGISPIAISSLKPVKFKSECAAFINSDIRSALQEGFDKNDIIAGLVSSIVNNYLTKVKGPRRVGRKIFLQGGVAKNQSIAYAFAQATSKQIIVPPDPELMGAFGVALMAIERENSSISADWDINSMVSSSMVKLNAFTCHACNNYCTVNRYQVGDRKFPFGGQCSKYENYWKQTGKIIETKDFVELRNKTIFSVIEPQDQRDANIRIGIPRALTTHTLLPLYYTFLRELGRRTSRRERRG